MDPVAQVDFHLQRIKVLCDRLEAHELVGNLIDIFIAYKHLTSTVYRSLLVHHINSTEHSWSANMASYIWAHLSYHEHKYLNFFENIHKDVSYLNWSCKSPGNFHGPKLAEHSLRCSLDFPSALYWQPALEMG